MKPMKFSRFRLYTLGSRRPAGFPGEFRELWESDAEDRFAILSTVADGTTHVMLMVRDAAGRFTPAGAVRQFATIRGARNAVSAILGAPADELVDVGFAGTDLFTPVAPAASLHSYFRRLGIVPHAKPAQRVLAEIAPWIRSGDPHFVREFQTHGFDQRLWEIYLWACFREAGFEVEQLEHPDFLLSKKATPLFSVEATTAAASQAGVLADHPNPNTQKEMAAFLRNYMPMKFGGALTAKLNRRFDKLGYWDLPKVEGLPFVLATADFHVAASRLEPGSMVYSQSALPLYLYGMEYSAEHDAGGELQIGYQKLITHSFKSKKIESGFFDLPEAENVSAVLFSNAGTISKFTRMGVVAGFGGEAFTYIRKGFVVDPDPNAAVGRPFAVNIADPNYREGWGDELQVFHNPRALRPLDHGLLPAATHHRWEEGQIVSYSQALSVLTSITHNIRAVADPAAEAAALAEFMEQ
jgi:hypothetical protein